METKKTKHSRSSFNHFALQGIILIALNSNFSFYTMSHLLSCNGRIVFSNSFGPGPVIIWDTDSNVSNASNLSFGSVPLTFTACRRQGCPAAVYRCAVVTRHFVRSLKKQGLTVKSGSQVSEGPTLDLISFYKKSNCMVIKHHPLHPVSKNTPHDLPLLS